MNGTKYHTIFDARRPSSGPYSDLGLAQEIHRIKVTNLNHLLPVRVTYLLTGVLNCLQGEDMDIIRVVAYDLKVLCF